jgi:hypothetical protein
MVGTVTRPWAGRSGIRISVAATDIYLLQNVAHLDSNSMGTGIIYRW